MPTKKNMRTRDSRLAKIMRPREKTCVPIRVILRFRELCIHGTPFLKPLPFEKANTCYESNNRYEMVCIKIPDSLSPVRTTEFCKIQNEIFPSTYILKMTVKSL